MSECVVRMEMPQHCGECNLYVNGWCYALTPDSPQEKEWYSSHKERPPMCPIICQLPEGHGRLIDADKLKAKKYHSNITNENAVAVAEIDWAETIAPAEAESTSPKPTDPVPIRDVYYVMTECDAKTGTVTYELRERSET